MAAESSPHGNLLGVERLLEDFVWFTFAPKHTMCFVHFAGQVEMTLVTKPDIVQPARICPDSLKEDLAHLLTTDAVPVG